MHWLAVEGVQKTSQNPQGTSNISALEVTNIVLSNIPSFRFLAILKKTATGFRSHNKSKIIYLCKDIIYCNIKNCYNLNLMRKCYAFACIFTLQGIR